MSTLQVQEIELILSQNQSGEEPTSLLWRCYREGYPSLGYLLGKKMCRKRWKERSQDFLDSWSLCAYYSGRYRKCLEILIYVIDHYPLDSEAFKRLIGNLSFCISKCKNDFTDYPGDIVKNLPYKYPNATVTFTITTCKRLDLFTRTMNSFLRCCLDLNLIAEFICVDDNSSEEDRQKMKELYPFFRFIWKDQSSKGHAKSMNILRQEVKTPYVFSCEDDWQFITPRHYIRDALLIISENPQIGQVLINRNYAETEADHNIVGGHWNRTSTGLNYILHEYYPLKSKELAAFEKRNPGPHNAYWPFYSLRPSLFRRNIWDVIGPYCEDPCHFEMEYAYRYVEAGYQSCFFPAIYCLHIGRLTSERETSLSNAYDLNNVCQYIQTSFETDGSSDINDSSSDSVALDLEKDVPIEIKPLAWFDTCEALCDHLNMQTKGNYQWNRIKLVSHDSPDYYLIMSCPGPTDTFVPERTLVFQSEPISEQNRERWGFWGNLDPTQFLHVRRYDIFPNCPDWHLGISYSELAKQIQENITVEKTKLFSAIVSSKYFDRGHKLRIDFLKYYESRDDVPPIDIFGFDNEHQFKSYQGPLPKYNKSKGLLPYKYTFAAENSSISNYYTEKIVDAILAECLCFYWGCPNLELYLHPQAFIRLPLEDPATCVDIIKETLNKDEWSKRLPYIRQAKQEILSRLQLFPTLERLLPIVHIPGYVINLDRRPDRYSNFIQKNWEYWEFTRFPAIDGRTLNLTPEASSPSILSYIGPRGGDILKLFEGNDFNTRPGVIGCALSHLTLWKQLSEDRIHRAYFICEDDATLMFPFVTEKASDVDMFRKLLRDVLQKENWDIVFLGAHLQNRYVETETDEEKKVFVVKWRPDDEKYRWYSNYIGGTFAYIISRDCATKLVTLARNGIAHAIDYWLYKLFSQFNVYFVEPCLATSPIARVPGIDDSDIQFS